MSHNQPSGLIINYWHLYYLLWSDLCTDCTPLSHSLTLGVGSITIVVRAGLEPDKQPLNGLGNRPSLRPPDLVAGAGIEPALPFLATGF